MKRFLLFLIPIVAAAQAYQFTQQIVTQNLPPGNYSPNAISTAVVIVNGTTYTNSTATASCAAGAPVVLVSSSTCQATPDVNGNIAFWMVPGSYGYFLRLTAGQILGPFYFSLGSAPYTPQFPSANFVVTVAQLPTSTSANKNFVYLVTNGASSSDCSTGGGTTYVFCASTGTGWQALGGSSGSSGTVTSVGLTLPGIFSVSGTPVTTSGIFVGTLVSQSQNLFFASPNGSSGTPTFRALVSADLPSLTSGASILYGNGSGFFSNVTVGSGLTFTGGTLTASGGGSGTVTSFSSGNLSPLFTTSVATSTTTPALSFSLSTQNANTIYAGPGSGSASAPTFRSLVAADLPSLTAGTSLLYGNGSGGFSNASVGTGLSFTGGTLSSTNSGTVTSVGLSLPSLFSVSGSPVTGSGTLTGSLTTQSANLVFTGPSSGSAAAPTFRSLVGADLPNPSASSLGGIESITSVSNEFLTSISTSGVPTQAQPSFSNLSGSLACGQAPALTGDTTTSAGSCTTTTAKVNGGSFPTSAHLLGTNSSTQPVSATGHDQSITLNCAAASGSGTAYTCSTTPTFAPATGDHILFKADVANTGSATLNVNSSTAYTIEKQGGGTALVANDLLAGTWCVLILDSTPHWQVQCPSGNAASGGGGAAYGTFSSLPGSSTSGQLYFTTDSPYSFVSNGSGGWTPFIPGPNGGEVTLPVTSGYSWSYQPTGATFSDAHGGEILYAGNNSTDHFATRAVEAVPSTPWSIQIAYQLSPWQAEYINSGIYAYNSSTGKGIVCGAAAGSNQFLQFQELTSFTSVSGNPFQIAYYHSTGLLWVKMVNDGTNIYCYESTTSGAAWSLYYSQPLTTYYNGASVTTLGYTLDDNSFSTTATPTFWLLHWLQGTN